MDGRYRHRSHLAPLEPNAFLRWVWERGDRAPGSSALTVDDVWWMLDHEEYTPEMVHKDYVRLAARVRRNQRLNLDPFEGIT